MRHEIDVMSFAPARYLHGFGEATNITDIDACELRQPLLDEGSELPF